MLSINWATRVIFIPQSFLTGLGGIKYRLDIEALRNALKDIEDDEAGIVHPKTHNRNAPSVLSGVTYTQVFEITNGYTVTFENTGVPYVVTCTGANHNLADVTNFDGGMSLVVGNSAGLIEVNVGGGGSSTLTAGEVWAYPTRALTTTPPSDAPTPEQNAAAVWAALMESGMSAADLLRLIASFIAGDGFGLESSTPSFKSLDGSKTRLQATYADGVRTMTTVDGT